MDKNWQLINERQEGLSVIETILFSKGITQKEEIGEFLSDKPQKTYDPFLIKNMQESIACIKKYVKEKKKIVIFGDYDVDGVCASTLLMQFFSHITNSIDYYIPNRFSEGYGLNKAAIDYIKEKMGGELIITVDNGVSCVEEVAYAKQLGLEMIVTDHHNPGEKLPECLVINVKQQEDTYPFKELCGCGVAFKLAQALQRIFDLPKTVLNPLLDIVALATVADIVPLVDENRTFVKYGLDIINKDKRLGLSVLRKVVGLHDKKITAGRIGFVLGPCFNAAGRLEDAKLGVKLLLETSYEQALKLANTLYTLNRERQQLQEQGEAYCKAVVEQQYIEDGFLVVRADHVSEGVIGIIAGKIKDIFYKPTLVVTKGEEGYLKGSGRSIKGINIFEELGKVSDLFIGFGGHEMACGFSIKEQRLDELREVLNKRAGEIKASDPNVFVPKLEIITELTGEELTVDLIREVEKLEPYGMGNSRPVFVIKNIKVNPQWTKACGSNKTHLKFSGSHGDCILGGIGFSLAEKYEKLQYPREVHIAFNPEINEYNGKIKPQMMIQDLKTNDL